MGFAHEYERKILDFLFGGGTLTSPANYQVGLCTGINDTGTDVTIIGEPSGGGYERVTVPNNTTTWELAITEDGQTIKKNKAEIMFPEATVSWGTVTHFFLYAENRVWGYGELTTAKECDAGDTPRFKAGDLVVKLYGV